MPHSTKYVGTQAEALARMAANQTISQPKVRPNPWQRFERLVQAYPEAWVIGLIIAAAIACHYIGN